MSKSFLDPTIPLQKEMGDQIFGMLNGSTLEFIRQECEAEYLDECAKEHREREGMMSLAAAWEMLASVPPATITSASPR